MNAEVVHRLGVAVAVVAAGAWLVFGWAARRRERLARRRFGVLLAVRVSGDGYGRRSWWRRPELGARGVR
ncbi:MAG TPA: type II secretion protein F, partial [Streptomyces sp.]|nr:type II secretion protein F [Streptomyces sp.]